MKSKKRVIPFIITVMLMVSNMNLAYAQNDANLAVKDLIDNYNKRLEVIQHLNNQEEQIQGQLSTINRQIYEYDQLVSELQPDIDKITMKMQSIQINISNTEKNIDYRNQLLKNRLNNMYTSGNLSVSFIEVLLGSTDFGDFINRVSMLTMVIKSDKQLIEVMSQDKVNLTKLKDELDQQQSLLLAQRNTLSSAKAAQEEKINQRIALLDQLQKKSQAEVDTAHKVEEDLSSIDAKLTPEVEAQLNAVLQNKVWSDGFWDWPVPSSHMITSDFGPRVQEFHAGIDIGAPIGTSIVAVDNGIVFYAGKANGFGNWVVIKHSNGLMSVYGHMFGAGIYVSVGQEVKLGQTIAVVGNDGQSTGPHLHFAVASGITGNKMNYIDPRPYLDNKKL